MRLKNGLTDLIRVWLNYLSLDHLCCLYPYSNRIFHSNVICLLYLCFFRREFTMELYFVINLILMFALNALFFVLGMCLNALVIISFWRNEQLRKKLCYFTIMILSCFDLLAIFSTNPLMAFLTLDWLMTGNSYYGEWYPTVFLCSNILSGFPLIALLVMNFDRYLATYYPLFHRTSVTRRKLLIPFVVLGILFAILTISSDRNFVISFPIFLLLCCVIFLFPMLFFNYKLFIIARKSRKNRKNSPEKRRTFSLKKISSCLLSTACFTVLTIPIFVYIWLTITSPGWEALVASLWARTIPSMNGTFNCLIFYWKNKVLRSAGVKVIKGLKLCRRE